MDEPISYEEAIQWWKFMTLRENFIAENGLSRNLIFMEYDNLPQSEQARFRKWIIQPSFKKGAKIKDAKFRKVLREFHAGKLRDSHGKLVKDEKQAIAIAFSEQEKSELNKGAKLKGKLHRDGGIKMRDKNGNNYELEDSELIINRRSSRIRKQIQCVGTPEGVASKINELGGGVSWSDDASCKFMNNGGKLSVSDLIPGRKYLWTQGAEYLTVTYIGKTKDFEEFKYSKPDSKIGSGGHLFKWNDSNKYVDVSPMAIYKGYVVNIEEEMNNGGKKYISDCSVFIDVDGEKQVLEDFITMNKDYFDKYPDQINEIKSLKIGDSIDLPDADTFGLVTIKRIEKFNNDKMKNGNKLSNKEKIKKFLSTYPLIQDPNYKELSEEIAQELKIDEKEVYYVILEYYGIEKNKMKNGKKLSKHIKKSNGGKKNNNNENALKQAYETGDAKLAWDSWTTDQRSHFLLDHSDMLENIDVVDGVKRYKITQKKYNDLPKEIKSQIETHLNMARYEDGAKHESSDFLIVINDESKPITINEFIKTNEGNIPSEDIEKIKQLKPGEKIQLDSGSTAGTYTVERTQIGKLSTDILHEKHPIKLHKAMEQLKREKQNMYIRIPNVMQFSSAEFAEFQRKMPFTEIRHPDQLIILYSDIAMELIDKYKIHYVIYESADELKDYLNT